MDYIVTPERVLTIDSPHERPTGLDWDALSEERIAEIPILDALRP